ncbi:hypothetical protein CBM2599_B120176 [Cupriavidus taiwanensis]|nr:hypothetical protein CBM2599_B120176 [Cupriavidus taiwanensis]SOY98375.1 hypothetical protein CBM2600_B130176 [Cupriavidus taiwanensis]
MAQRGANIGGFYAINHLTVTAATLLSILGNIRGKAVDAHAPINRQPFSMRDTTAMPGATHPHDLS